MGGMDGVPVLFWCFFRLGDSESEAANIWLVKVNGYENGGMGIGYG